MSAARYYEGWARSDFMHALESGYLTEVGWLRSVEEREAVDCAGPVPWFTYASQKFLSGIISDKFSVCEYGCGGSTAWWASRVAHVTSIEHDLDWRSKIETEIAAKGLADRVTFLEPSAEVPQDLRDFLSSEAGPDEEDHGYSAYASSPLKRGDTFDVVVIDGRGRNACAYVAARILAPGGFIIFDNTDRRAYDSALRHLRRCGFYRVDFWGLGPINPYEWCTSILFRDPAIFSDSACSTS